MNKFGTSRQLALSFAILMILCTFLPWSRVILHDGAFSFNSIINTGPAVPGIYFITGLISFIISILASIFIFYWETGAIITAGLNLVIACVHIFEVFREPIYLLSDNFLHILNSKVTPYPAEPVIGVFMLAFTSLLFLIQILHCMNEETYGHYSD